VYEELGPGVLRDGGEDGISVRSEEGHASPVVVARDDQGRGRVGPERALKIPLQAQERSRRRARVHLAAVEEVTCHDHQIDSPPPSSLSPHRCNERRHDAIALGLAREQVQIAEMHHRRHAADSDPAPGGLDRIPVTSECRDGHWVVSPPRRE